MLKHHPKDVQKKIEKTLPYCKKHHYYNSTAIDKRIHNGAGIPTTGLNAGQIASLKANFAKDFNTDERIAKFKDHLENEYVYRIPKIICRSQKDKFSCKNRF